MCSIVIAIRPEYVTKILDGSKTFEYRRALPTKKLSFMLIYETSPV